MCAKLFIFIVSAILVTGIDVNCPPTNLYPCVTSYSNPYSPIIPDLPYDVIPLNAPMAPVQPISPILQPVRPIAPVLPSYSPDPVPLPIPVPPVCGINEIYIPQGIAPNCDTECSRLGQPCNRVCIKPASGCYCIPGHGRNANNVCVPLCQCPVSCSPIAILY